MRRPKYKKTKKEVTFTGLYDDNDDEIHIGMELLHESGWIVEVIKLPHGEIASKAINFCCDNGLGIIYYSLNNGQKFTIINKK